MLWYLKKPMKYSGLDKLVFIASFMWFMNWGSRLVYLILSGI